MPSFLIEVRQESALMARKRIVDSVRTMGSHFATHADWKRKAGGCTGTMTIEADDKRLALGVVPPAMRPQARVIALDARTAA
jgi:hypothetical protein